VHAGALDDAPDHPRRGRVAHEEGGVDLALLEGVADEVVVQVEQGGGAAGLDAVRLQQRERQDPRAAALGPDHEPLARERRQPVRGRRAAHEDVERLARDGAERGELPPRLGRPGVGQLHADLDERDVHVAGRVGEPPEVLERAVGRPEPEGDAVLLESLDVPLRRALEAAALRARREGDRRRRRGAHEVQHRPDRHRDRDRERQQRDEQVAPRDAQEPSAATRQLEDRHGYPGVFADRRARRNPGTGAGARSRCARRDPRSS
jgi:hypothetical protein